MYAQKWWNICWNGRDTVLPRDAMLAQYMPSSCVLPSACPSQTGTVPNG